MGLALALWSANNGIKALFDAMNIAYEETEKRGFVMLNLFSAAFTLGALLIGICLLLAVGAVPALLALLHLERWTETLIAIGRWPLLIAAIWLGISLIYLYGPSRTHAKWRWLNWGAGIATVVWIAASAAFVLPAELRRLQRNLWPNAEMERQTARDSTVGPAKPMGERGAVVADTVATSRQSND